MPANNLWAGLLTNAKASDRQSVTTLDTQHARSFAALPAISLGSSVRYVENAAPVVLAPAGTFHIGDARLAYGRLSVSIGSNATAADRLAFHVSSAQINVAGSTLRYGDKAIGRIEQATAGQLVIQFNAQATVTEAQAAIRSVTFRNVSENPSGLTRAVRFQFIDSSGVSSNAAIKQVAVQAVNDLPRVVISGGRTYQSGQEAVVLEPNAVLSDPDTADFNGGQILVTIARNIQPGDRIMFRSTGTGQGQIKVSDFRIYYEGRLFATYLGGSGGSGLAIRFLNGATPDAVQQLLRSIAFTTTGEPLSTRQRNITFEMSDRLIPELRTYKVVDGKALSLGIVKPDAWKATDRRPALLFVAGTWISQGKNWWNERIAYFASRGIVCIRAITRTIPEDSTLAPDEPAQDIKSAMRWIRAHAAELGIDPQRIGAVGASAGGHLAAVTAMIDGLNDPHDNLSVSAKANALLMFNGVVDTGPDGGWGYNRVGDRYREFSPVENVSADDPPTFEVSGTADETMPFESVKRFKAALDAAGVRTDFHYYADMEHGFMNATEQNGHYFYETLIAADKFLVSLGWLHGPATFLRPAADRVAMGLGLPWYAGMKTVSVKAG